MPQRFVEVLDLQSEATTILESLASKTSGITTNLKLNVTQYINSTAGLFDAKLVSVLESYNMSREDIFDTMNLLNLNMTNTTLGQLDRPKPIPMYLMSIGSALILAHLVLVNVLSKRLVNDYGNHGKDGISSN